jgi:hypothetical protein
MWVIIYIYYIYYVCVSVIVHVSYVEKQSGIPPAARLGNTSQQIASGASPRGLGNLGILGSLWNLYGTILLPKTLA